MSGRFAAIMSLVLLPLAAPAVGAGNLHVVTQVDITFLPETVVAAPGDTIRWVWTSGFHTVTSGTDCTPDGIHFNEPLFESSPTVEYVIPEDFVGDIPYYCAPHCSLGMVGNIEVADESGCPEDIDASGDVGFGDILRVLEHWGPCPPDPPCPEDLNMDGEVSFADVLRVLGVWGPC